MAVAGPCWACHGPRDGVEDTPPRLERGSMREQASSRGTRLCPCYCLNRSQRALCAVAMRAHATTGRHARLPVRRRIFSHARSPRVRGARGKRELSNNLSTSRANERNDASSSALSSQAPTAERPFVLPPVTDEDTRCLRASAIPTVSVRLRLYHSSAPSRAYGVTRR
jgi:hypothetical protein